MIRETRKDAAGGDARVSDALREAAKRLIIGAHPYRPGTSIVRNANIEALAEALKAEGK